MKKSVSQQLLEYLQNNPGVVASGELQRMEWRNRDGYLATPRSIVRRLQELQEDGKIFVQTIAGHAHYSANPAQIPPPKPKLLGFKETPTGERIAVMSN